MKSFIVKKNRKLNTLLSIYFFLLISFLGALVGSYLAQYDRSRSIKLGKNALKENSMHSFNDVVSKLEEKIVAAKNSNKIVSDFILNPGLGEITDEYSDQYSQVVIPSIISSEDRIMIYNTKILWKSLSEILLKNFNNFWFISKSNFSRISPSKYADDVKDQYNFLDSIYYKVGTPENNPNRDPTWTPVYFDNLLNTWVTSLVIPVYNDDKFYGVTGTDLYLSSAIKEIKHIIGDSTLLEVLVYDNNGVLIANSNDKLDKELESFIDKSSKSAGEILTFKAQNETFYSITYKIDFLNWNVSYFFRESKLSSNLFDTQITLFILIIIISLIIVLLSWVVINRVIIKPINALSIAASDFDFGKTVERYAKRNDEIGSLTMSYMTMGKTIKDQIREINAENIERLESEKKYRRLIENLGKEYFFYSYSTLKAFTYVGDSVEDMLGYSPDDFIEKFESLLTDSDINKGRHKRVDNSTKGIKQDPYYIELYSKSGDKKLLEIVETPIFNTKHHVISIEGIAHDITEIKKSELELKMHKENLEEIISERTKELEKTLLELVETKKMAALGELVSGVAHEINTPVGIGVTGSTHLTDIIKNFEELFLTNKLSKTKFETFINEMKETAKIIFTNMNKAASLIKGFKEIAVDQTSEDIRSFDIKEYIDEILLSIHSEIKHTKHNILVKCPENLKLTTYPGAISQVLTNLIFNTLIHGFEDIDAGNIFIEVEVISKNIEITYSDNGKGIDKNHLDKIYNPFFTTKRGAGGSGLGMNIVLNLVQKSLKGTITCISSVGEGTQFKIVFPKEIGED